MHSQRLEVREDGRPWQFSLPALCGVTLSVGVLCSLARFGASYVVAALTLGFATLLIRLYVQSGYQQRLRVQGTLLGGLLFLSSLWLPIGPDRESVGWQAAAVFLDLAWRLNYASLGRPELMNLAFILSIDVTNILALLLPACLIWKPQKTSRLVSLVCVVGTGFAWTFPFQDGLFIPDPLFMGYWTWAISLTTITISRCIPFEWQTARRQLGE